MTYRLFAASSNSLAELHIRTDDRGWPEYFTVRRDHDDGDETEREKPQRTFWAEMHCEHPGYDGIARLK